MNCRDFVEAIDGKEFKFTRQCLATNEVRESGIVSPCEPRYHKNGLSSIDINLSICCYSDDNCLFTNNYGIFVAVVETGAGHLFCDRFEPID